MALCEQIYTVSHTRFGTYLGHATDDEMDEVERALLRELCITVELENDPPEQEAEIVPSDTERPDIIELQTELRIYKQLYSDLLLRMTKPA